MVKDVFGFVKPTVVTPVMGQTESLTLRPSSESPDIFKIDVPGSGGREFFILENRQSKGFDEGLSYNVDKTPLHGLVVYHVVNDILARNFRRPNEAASWDTDHTGNSSVKKYTDARTGEYHYGISLVQADGSYYLKKVLKMEI